MYMYLDHHSITAYTCVYLVQPGDVMLAQSENNEGVVVKRSKYSCGLKSHIKQKRGQKGGSRPLFHPLATT